MVLATPIESADDMTMLSLGIRSQNSCNIDCNSSTMSVIQSGVTVSRKAKLKFQAISLAYDILSNEAKRRHYHEWRLWNPRLPPPQFDEDDDRIHIKNTIGLRSTFKESRGDKDLTESKDCEIDMESRTSVCGSMYSSTGSILYPSRYGSKKLNRLASNRKIIWNEEVEELVILPDDYNDSMETIDRAEYWNDIGSIELTRNDPLSLLTLDTSVRPIADIDESGVTSSLNGSYGHNISVHTETPRWN